MDTWIAGAVVVCAIAVGLIAFAIGYYYGRKEAEAHNPIYKAEFQRSVPARKNNLDSTPVQTPRVTRARRYRSPRR